MNLKHRAPGPELMDAPDVPPDALEHALRHLEVINRYLNGYGPSLLGISRILPPGCKTVKLLDVGCGSGDTLRRIAKWARQRRIKAELTGIELSETTVRRAKEACVAYPEIQVRHDNLFTMSGDSYDIVHCSLVLHHLPDGQLSHALERMARFAKLGIVVNDLHRHPVAFYSIAMLTRLLSRSYILQHDAPLSVARGFSREELNNLADRSNLREVELNWNWAFRWLLTAKGSGSI